MDKLLSYDQILESVDNVKDKATIILTNFFLDKMRVELYINHNLLYWSVIGETLFIIKNQESFYTVYFCSIDLVHLKTDITNLKVKLSDKPIVLEVIGKQEFVGPLSQSLNDLGYIHYASLVRMVNISGVRIGESDGKIVYPQIDRIDEILRLLKKYFDVYSEQIPLREELELAINCKKVLIHQHENKIVGFLIFDVAGVTAHLKYWFTHPGHRDKKIGSKLFKDFIHETFNSKRRLFWVMENNENAIKRYNHYGFIKENMYDKILIHKNK
jgi:ribosomal protein S18 acetylase RimI-like enzyme